jgi:hypothetical protein
MRTTIDIEDDMLNAAKHLARARSVSLGRAVSDLMRRGIQTDRSSKDDNGIPIFVVSPDSRPITLEDVKRLEDLP